MIYQGLVNEGATCYLNSLIQTLFMTYEFRKNVYAYIHDPKKIQQKDSIPYQLQKLFVNLQTNPYPCYSKSLLKSFQWTEAQAFQQHDVQQFCRILFDAIEASHKNTLWIKGLFGFLMNSFIDCGKHKSTNSQEYLDISLPVKNIYTQTNYNSVEQCLKQYFMPETIQGVECSGCQTKVQVKKGLMLQSLPSILTIQLNRFQLNQSFQREKINSFLYYPEILQLHRFNKPYHQIQIKGIPSGLQSRKKFIPKEKSKRTIDLSIPTISQNTKKRRGSDDKIAVKEHVSYLDEQNRNKRGPQIKQLSQQEEKNKNLQILASLKQDKFTNLQKLVKKKKQEVSPPVVEQQEDMLFGTLAQGYSFSNPALDFSKNIEVQNVRPKFQSGDIKYEHEQESFDKNKQYADGTYALYAVLIHSGGSYGGHYYAYISDGENWYKFDDSKVTKVEKTQIRKYGSNEQTTSGTNAYLLFYRKTSTFRQIKSIQIPAQLLQKVNISNKLNEVQQQKQRQRDIQKQKRNLQIEQSLLIKVYINDKDEPKSIKIINKGKQSVGDLKQKVKQILAIQQKDQNWRMRRYNKQDNSMHEVYDKQLYDCSLQTAGFRQYVTITLQFKTDEQIFDDYDPNKIVIKVNIWQKDIIMVSQKLLKPLKIKMHLNDSYQGLFNEIIKQTKIDNLLVIKRNYMGLCPISAIPLQQNKAKKLIQLRFFNNVNLYVEENTEAVKPKWAQQFQNQKYRCFIKFNNPKVGQSRDEEIYFDSRRTLGQLKKYLSQIIGISQENFRIKKGKQLPQLITFKKKLNDLKFINNQFLYIEQGRSSQGSVTLKRGTVQLIEDQIQFQLHEQIQIQLTPEILTIQNLCQAIAIQTGLPQQQIRIRQYLATQFRQIYAHNDLIQRIRHKNLIWEFLQSQQQRGFQIYYRVFDVMTFELGQLRQLYIEGNATYEQLSLLLEEDCAIAHNKLLVHKSINSYIDKAVLFDCPWLQIRYVNATIKESPLDIRCDGQILVIKQAQQIYKPNKMTTNKVQANREGGEAKLKITVIAENEIELGDIQKVISQDIQKVIIQGEDKTKPSQTQ